jgi:hypothetical protein
MRNWNIFPRRGLLEWERKSVETESEVLCRGVATVCPTPSPPHALTLLTYR